MTPQDQDAQHLQQDSLKKAKDLFESLPGFAAAMVRLYEALRTVNQRDLRNPAKSQEERFASTCRAFDAHAAAYLELVSDMETQKAFVTVLEDLIEWAWVEYAGCSIAPFVRSGNPDVETVLERYLYWKNEGYRKLAELTAAGIRPSAPTLENPRPQKTYREPKADLRAHPESSLSRKRAAEALGISERTLDRWVAGKKLAPIPGVFGKRFKAKDLIRIIEQRDGPPGRDIK